MLLFCTPPIPQTREPLRRLGRGAPHGFGVVAAVQTGGRGRLGRKWQSVQGKGLYCSLILRPRLDIADYPKITMTAGLGTAVALERLTGLQFGLKWPNDVYCNGKKCCGILSESSSSDREKYAPFAIVGVGINITTEREEFEEEVRARATSLFLETGRIFAIDDVFTAVRNNILEYMEKLERNGFAPLLARWKKRDIFAGARLEWVTPAGGVVLGESLGPDDAGRLIVRDETGRCHRVISGDISLAGRLSRCKKS